MFDNFSKLDCCTRRSVCAIDRRNNVGDRSVVDRPRHWDNVTLNANTQPSSRSLRVSWSRKGMTWITTSAADDKCKSNVLMGDAVPPSPEVDQERPLKDGQEQFAHAHIRTSGPGTRIVIHWRSVNASWRRGELWMSISRPSSSLRSYVPRLGRDTHKSHLCHSTSATFVHFFLLWLLLFLLSTSNEFGMRVIQASNSSGLVVHSCSESLSKIVTSGNILVKIDAK